MGSVGTAINNGIGTMTDGIYNPNTGIAKNLGQGVANFTGGLIGQNGSNYSGQGFMGTGLGSFGGSAGSGSSSASTDTTAQPTLSPYQSILSTPEMGQYSEMANSAGPSAWATGANSQARLQNTQQLNNASAQSAASTGQANAGLAASGGLSSGARERNTENGQTNYLSMVQGANNTLNTNQANIATQDAATKRQMQGNLLNMQAQDTMGQNQYNAGAYKAGMTGWAANQTSAAMAAAAQQQQQAQQSTLFGSLGL